MTTLLRCEMLDGYTTKWRPLLEATRKAEALAGRSAKEVQALALCDVFGLDPHRVYFDLPSSFLGTGSTSAGAGGVLVEGRTQGGFVLERGTDRRVGKVVVVRESERFRDVDPRDEREFDRL